MKRFLLALLTLLALGGALALYLGWRATQGIAPQALEAKYMTQADRFVEVAGARVRVREEGPQDAPPVILLHGFVFSLESWDGWAKALAQDYRVIRFDLAGHGLTGPDSLKRYAPQERAAFIREVMDALGVERAVIAGNSLGGLAAWRFAANNPERVAGLILVSAAAFPANGVADTPLAPPKQMELFLRTVPAAGVRATAQIVYGDDSKITDRRLEVLRDMMRRRGNGAAFIESINEFVLPDPGADLARVRAPTLILWGEEDLLIPVEQGGRIAASIGGAKFVTFRGVGHVAQEEAPAETAAEAKAFLDALERSAD